MKTINQTINQLEAGELARLRRGETIDIELCDNGIQHTFKVTAESLNPLQCGICLEVFETKHKLAAHKSWAHSRRKLPKGFKRRLAKKLVALVTASLFFMPASVFAAQARQPKQPPIPKALCLSLTGFEDVIHLNVSGDPPIRTDMGTIKNFKISGLFNNGFIHRVNGGGFQTAVSPHLWSYFNGNFGRGFNGFYELVYDPSTQTGLIYYNYEGLGIKNKSSVTPVPCIDLFFESQSPAAANQALAVGGGKFSVEK